METSLLMDYETNDIVTHVGSRGRDTFNQNAGNLGRRELHVPQKPPVESLLLKGRREVILVNHWNEGSEFPHNLSLYEGLCAGLLISHDLPLDSILFTQFFFL